MISAFIIGLLLAAAMAVITIAFLSVKWVVEKIKERIAANKRHKVIFADMTETVDKITREQKEQQKEYSMDELNKICQDAPYVFADYDIDTENVSDYTGIKAESVDPKIIRKLKEEGGMIVFDS